MEVEFPPSDDDSIYESEHEVVLERPPLSPVGRPLTGYAAKTLDDALDIIEAEEMSSDEPESSEGSTEALSESLDPISDDDMVDVNANVGANGKLPARESEEEDVAPSMPKAVPNATNVDVHSLAEAPDAAPKEVDDDDAMADTEAEETEDAGGMDFMMSDLDPPAPSSAHTAAAAEEPDDMEMDVASPQPKADNGDFVPSGPVSDGEVPSVTEQLPVDRVLQASADGAHSLEDDPEVEVESNEPMSRPTSMGEEVLFEAGRSSDDRSSSQLDAGAAEQLVIDAEVEAPKLLASDDDAVDALVPVESQREVTPEPTLDVDVPQDDDSTPEVEVPEAPLDVEEHEAPLDVEDRVSMPAALVDEEESSEAPVEPESNDDSDSIAARATDEVDDVDSKALSSREVKEDDLEGTESPVKVEETMTKSDDSWTKASVGVEETVTKSDDSWTKTGVDESITKSDDSWTKANVGVDESMTKSNVDDEETQEEAVEDVPAKEGPVEVDETLTKADSSWTKAVDDEEASEDSAAAREVDKTIVDEKTDEEEEEKEEEPASAGPFSFRSTLASFGASVFGKFASTATEDERAAPADDAEKSQEENAPAESEVPQGDEFADAETEIDTSEASRALPEPQVIEQLVEEAAAKVDAEESAKNVAVAEDEKSFGDAEESSLEPEAAPQLEAEPEEELVAEPEPMVEAEPEAKLEVEAEPEAKLEVEAEPESKLEVEAESEPEPEATVAEREVVLDTEQEAAREVEPEAEPEELQETELVAEPEVEPETAPESVPETAMERDIAADAELDLEEEELEKEVKMTPRVASISRTAEVMERTESGQENLVVAPAIVELDMNKETVELLEKGEVKTPELTKEETRQLDLSNTSLDVPDVEDVKDHKNERSLGLETLDDSLQESMLQSGLSLDDADTGAEMDEIQIDKPMTRMVTAPPIPGGSKSMNKTVPPVRALSADEFGADQYIVEETVDGKAVKRNLKSETPMKGGMMRTASSTKSLKKSGGGGFLSSMSSFYRNIRKPSKSKEKKKEAEAGAEEDAAGAGAEKAPRESEQSDKKLKTKDKKRRTFIARDPTKKDMAREKSATDSANGSVRQDSLGVGEVDNMIEMRTPEEKAEEERHLRLEETLKSQIATLRSARSGFVDLALLTPMTEKTLAMVEFEAKRILNDLPEVEKRKEELARRVELLEMTTESELLQKEKTLVAAKIKVAEARCELDKLRHELFILNRELNEPRKDIAHQRMRLKARKAKAQKELGAATESKETMERNLEQRKAMLSSCKAEVSQLEKSVKDIAGEW